MRVSAQLEAAHARCVYFCAPCCSSEDKNSKTNAENHRIGGDPDSGCRLCAEIRLSLLPALQRSRIHRPQSGRVKLLGDAWMAADAHERRNGGAALRAVAILDRFSRAIRAAAPLDGAAVPLRSRSGMRGGFAYGDCDDLRVGVWFRTGNACSS